MSQHVSLLFDSLREHIEKVVNDGDQKTLILSEIEDLRSRIHEASQVLDRMPLGIIVTRQDAEVILINRYAREVLQADDGLSLNKGHLTCQSVSTARQLRRDISASADDPRGETHALAVSRPSGAPPLMCLITSAGANSAAVFLTDPESRPIAHHAIISELYGLTHMEAVVGASIAHGCRLTDTARKLGISINTARAHLRQVYAKTGATRQLELVNKIGNVLGIAWPEDDAAMRNVVQLRKRSGRSPGAPSDRPGIGKK